MPSFLMLKMLPTPKKLSLFLILVVSLSVLSISSVIGYTPTSAIYLRVINDRGVKQSQYETSHNVELLFQDKYHNLSEVYEELTNFNDSKPELVDFSSIGYSYYGNKIPLITLTNEKIDDEIKAKTYIVAHHHAREICTIEESLRLIRDLINDYGYDSNTTSLLNRNIIYIIVTLNPDSLDYTLYQNEHFRKSMKPYDDDGDGLLDEDGPEDINNDGKISEYCLYNATNMDAISRWIEGTDKDNDGKIGEDPPGGVDLNRNYPFHWNDTRAMTGSTSDKTSFTYPGPAPFSENETRVLDNFVQQHNFTHALSIHSGIATLCYGWSWNKKIIQNENQIYSSMESKIRNEGLLPSNFFPLDNIDYTCAGEWGDYMYSEYKIIAMTLEIYGRTAKSIMGIVEENETHKLYQRKFYDFKQFNPPSDEIESLHQSLSKFNKFWLSLTPKISLTSYSYRKLNNGENEVSLNLRSGSLYWNTTDNPKMVIFPSREGIVENYTKTIPTLFPTEDQTVKILLSPEFSGNASMIINISSGWATDLSMSLTFTVEDFKANQTIGFAWFSATLALVLLIRKK
jgi:hypothetical protein